MKEQLLFDNIIIENKKVVNVASVPQRSPFRYPGGKTWFVPTFRKWIGSLDYKPKLLVEPFAGGGIITLTAICEDLVESAIMVELDNEIASVWKAVLSGKSNLLVDKILNFNMEYDNAKMIVENNPKSEIEKAFKTIVKNRVMHGGIITGGSGFLKHGEAGKGVKSRWYPETLAKRIRVIDSVRNKIKFLETNAFDIIKENLNDKKAVFFIDPPYTAGGKNAGKRLYTHHEVDHNFLFQLCSKIKGDFIMTYDNAEEVINIAEKYGFDYKSIPMKSTHHAQMTELVIGNNLSWLD